MTVMQQEQFSELSTDVVQSISKLSEIVLALRTNNDRCASLLGEYKQQLNDICGVVDSGDYAGFNDLVQIYNEGLEQLIMENRALSEPELEFIDKFPHLLSEYLNFPSSKITASILVRHFKNDDWLKPITDDQYEKFMAYLLDEEVDATNEMQVDNEIDLIDYITDEEKEEKADETSLDIDDMLILAEEGNRL